MVVVVERLLSFWVKRLIKKNGNLEGIDLNLLAWASWVSSLSKGICDNQPHLHIRHDVNLRLLAFSFYSLKVKNCPKGFVSCVHDSKNFEQNLGAFL